MEMIKERHCVWEALVYDHIGRGIGVRIMISEKGINIIRSLWRRVVGLEDDHYIYDEHEVRETLQELNEKLKEKRLKSR